MSLNLVIPDRRRLPHAVSAEPPAAQRLRRAQHERLHTRLRDARFETDRLFGLLRGDSLLARPVPDRARLIYYLGHLEAFDGTLLCRDGLGVRPFDREFDELFARDRNPLASGGPLDDRASDWPSAPAIRVYGRKVRAAIDAALESCAFGGRVAHPEARDCGAIELAIEHRLAIAEQIAVLIHHLPPSGKSHGPLPLAGGEASANRWIDVSAGRTTLGLEKEASRFAQDIEYGAHDVQVKAFAIQSQNVTNGDFMKFVESRGYHDEGLWSREGWAWRKAVGAEHPVFWQKKSGNWHYKAMFGEVVPLPKALPVHVSRHEAEAYAKWTGSRLPTEAEFHRAAFGPITYQENGEGDRSFPWGETAPWPSYGLFGFECWDAHPVGSHRAGDSPSGISDLVGNGWEWTSTSLGPHPGFTPSAAAPDVTKAAFSAGATILKGASPRTSMSLIRRSFRHYSHPGHRHGYNTFRCVKSAE